MTEIQPDTQPTYNVESFLHDSTYMPEERRFSTGNEPSNAFYFRVKLGIETGRQEERLIADEERATKLTQSFRIGGYVKSGVENEFRDGFYFCTHPMTLDYHKQARWEKVLHRMSVMGFRSHDRKKLLIISINRNDLGDDDAQRAFIVNAINFYDKQWPAMLAFNRRRGSDSARYHNPGPINALNELPDATNYDAVEVTADSINFRMGRGTFVLRTFYATLQMTNEICCLCRRDSLSDIRRMAWSNMQRRVYMKYPELDAYLRERGLM